MSTCELPHADAAPILFFRLWPSRSAWWVGLFSYALRHFYDAPTRLIWFSKASTEGSFFSFSFVILFFLSLFFNPNVPTGSSRARRGKRLNNFFFVQKRKQLFYDVKNNTVSHPYIQRVWTCDGKRRGVCRTSNENENTQAKEERETEEEVKGLRKGRHERQKHQ